MKEFNTIMLMKDKHSISYNPDEYIERGETLPTEIPITPVDPTHQPNQVPPKTDPDRYLETGEQIFP